MKWTWRLLLGLILLAMLASVRWLVQANITVASIFGLESAVVAHETAPGYRNVQVLAVFPSDEGWQVLVTWENSGRCYFTRDEVRLELSGWAVGGTHVGRVPCQGDAITWGHGMASTGPRRFRAVSGEVRDPRVAKVTVLFDDGEKPALLAPRAFLLFDTQSDDFALVEIRAYDEKGNLLQVIDRQHNL